MRFLIQGSSRSWAGDIEHCMYEIDGKPAIYWTIKRVYDNFDNSIVQLIAPEYDKGGELELLKNDFDKLEIFYGFDSSPLNRMIESTKDLNDNEHFVRMNALNFQFDIDFIKEMYKIAKENNYDCVKLKDDFPVHFVGEIYKVSSLKLVFGILESKQIDNYIYHHIHPKFILMKLKYFNTKYYIPTKKIANEEIFLYKEKMKQVMVETRHNSEGKNSISAGDQLAFHYELSELFLNEKNINNGTILDIACGTGYGTTRFDKHGLEIYGADIDEEQILSNQRLYSNTNIKFLQEDVLNLSFDSNYFDVILSMETIEHVDPDKMLISLQRVLKRNGYLIISTPQNSMKECVNPQHIYEYSLDEIVSFVSKYFNIEKIIGIKAGKIYFEDDPIGANTMIFAKKVD